MAEMTLRRHSITLAVDQSLSPSQTQAAQDSHTYLDEAIRLDQAYFDTLSKMDRVDKIPVDHLRLTLAYWDRAQLLHLLGQDDLAASDEQAAITLDPTIAKSAAAISDRPLQSWSHLIDLLSWQDSVVGAQMTKPHARMAVLLSDAELAATSNIDFVTSVQSLKKR